MLYASVALFGDDSTNFNSLTLTHHFYRLYLLEPHIKTIEKLSFLILFYKTFKKIIFLYFLSHFILIVDI